MKFFLRLACKFSFIVLIASCNACRPKTLSREGLVKYINDPDNGLIQTRQIGDISISLLYRPEQLMESKLQTNKISNQGLDPTGKYFFVLGLSFKNKELLKQLPFEQYSEMVQVLSFRMSSYLSLVPDTGKPIEPIDCLFQQTYGMARQNQLLVVFKKQDLINAKKLNLSVNEFGLHIGNIVFHISTDNIKKIPLLTN